MAAARELHQRASQAGRQAYRWPHARAAQDNAIGQFALGCAKDLDVDRRRAAKRLIERMATEEN